MQQNHIDIESLEVEQRLQLIEELWNSLLDKSESLPLTAAQKEKLDRRLDEIDAGDVEGIPLEDVMNRIRSRMD